MELSTTAATPTTFFGAIASSSPVQPGVSIVSLTTFFLGVNDVVVVAQQQLRDAMGPAVYFGTAVGYRGLQACHGDATDAACLGAALWSNTRIVSTTNTPPATFAEIPIDVAPARLTAANGYVVATPVYAAEGDNSVTYTSVATGEIVMSVALAGLGPTPLLIGRTGTDDPLVAVSPVVGVNSPHPLRLLGFDMSKAPEFGGADVPEGFSMGQTTVDPATGATFVVYTSTNATIVRLSDGRKVALPGSYVLGGAQNMRVFSAETLCVWGSTTNQFTNNNVKAIVLIDRVSATVVWHKYLPVGAVAEATIVVPNKAAYALIFDGEKTNAGTIYDLRDPTRIIGRSVDSVLWGAFVSGGASYFYVLDQTSTQLLVSTGTKAAVYNFVDNVLVSNYTTGSSSLSIGSAVIVDEANSTFVTCENSMRMVKTSNGTIVGGPVSVNCYSPLAVTRGDAYTLSDVAVTPDGPYKYFVARPDFTVGRAAMMELPGRTFNASLSFQTGSTSIDLQATGVQQIAVVSIGDVFSSSSSSSSKTEQLVVGSGPAGTRVTPYVAAVDLVVGAALWVAPQDGTIGAWPYGISYLGDPLQAKGAENLLLTTYRYPTLGQNAVLAVDIFSGDVVWSFPVGAGSPVVTVVAPTLTGAARVLVTGQANSTFEYSRTGLQSSAAPAGFRPADTPVFPVTSAPSPSSMAPTTVAPGPPGNAPPESDGGLSTGAKVGIAIGCIVAGLGLVGGVVFAVMQSRRRREGGGDSYAEIEDSNNRGSRVQI